MNLDDLSSSFADVLENLNKKTQSNYCALCDIQTSSETVFLSHILGRKHQSTVRRIETAGFENWVKTAAKNAKRKTGQSKKSNKKGKVSRNNHRCNIAHKKVIQEEKVKTSQGAQNKKNKKELKVSVPSKGRNDKNLNSHVREANYSKISNAHTSCSSVEKTPSVVPPDKYQGESVPQFFSSSEMEPHGNFRAPPPPGPLLPLPRFTSRRSSPNYRCSTLDSRPPYWQQCPPQTSYRGRYQPQYGHASRMFSPAGAPPFKQQNIKQGMNSKDLTPQKSKGSRKGGSQIENGQTRFSGSKATHRGKRSKDSEIRRSSRNLRSYQKSNDGHIRPDSFSSNTNPHMEASFDMEQYSFSQGEQFGNTYPQNSKDSRRRVYSQHEHRNKSYSPCGSEKRHSTERQRDPISEASGSRRRSNPCHSSDDSCSRSENGSEVRSSSGLRNEKTLPRQSEKSTECSKTNQSKKKDVNQSSKTSENTPKKSLPDRKLSDCDETRSQPSKSDKLVTPKSPTFSNVTMQRMNARLHSLAKYGKMPTSGKIRNLALSAVPAQDRRDGKLREWSRNIESHHNLSAQDKELINRLVNYPSSRREQKKLEYCLRELARTRKKLTLPRFNLQLSSMDDSKEPSGVDDNVNSMVTEVVDCLPEDVLNSLINALNSDVDEYVAVSLPLSMDGCTSLPPEEGNGVCSSSDSKSSKKYVDEDVFLTVDEVGDNSSCDETADCPVRPRTSSDDSHAVLSHSSKTVDRPLLQIDKNLESSSNTVINHTSPVKATEHLVRGSSLEICAAHEVLSKTNSKADQQQTISVKVEEEPYGAQGRNTEKHSDLIRLNNWRQNKNVAVPQLSENPLKTLPALSDINIQIKNEQSHPQMEDVEVIELSPVPSHSSDVNSSSSCVNSGILDSTVKNSSPQVLNARPYPGLSYIVTPSCSSVDQATKNKAWTTQVESLNSGNILTLSSLNRNHLGGVQTFHALGNQQFQCSLGVPVSIAATPVIKVEASNAVANEDAVTEEFLLPKISCVTSIRSSDNFTGNNPVVVAGCSEASFKQEPVSPRKIPTLNGKAEEGSETNNSKTQVRRTPSVDIAATVNSPSHSLESHNVPDAATFSGAIHRVSSFSQKEDVEKISEVSSSTGALSDEVQSTSRVLQDRICHEASSSNDMSSGDLIRELLSITSAEEKLVQQASEAERTIAQLTASLEEWKRKKYEIEHEQLKLRMKRQELLLRNVAKGSIPHDKYSSASIHSAANDKTSIQDSSSDDEGKMSLFSMQSASTVSAEKSESESESSSSESPNRTHHHGVSNHGKKAKMSQDAHNLKNKGTVCGGGGGDDLSDSSVSFTSKQASKRKSRGSSSPKDDQCSSAKRSHKKLCFNLSPQVVLQPLQLISGDSGGKIVLNNNNNDDDDDDIIILEDSPASSVDTTEETERDSSSDDESVIIQGEVESISSEEYTSALTQDIVVKIETLNAHNGAIIDLKVYDGYLYSCSLDCIAKRFSLKDPTNDCTSYKGHQRTVTSICLSPGKEVYTTSLDTFLRCFVAHTGDIVDSFEMKSGITSSCAGGGMLYLGLNSGEVLIFSFTNKKVIYQLKCTESGISKLATTTQGAQRLLCVVANDGIVSLYDTRTAVFLRCLETHVRPPCCVQICDDSVYITTSEKSIVIHSLLSGSLVKMVNWAASATGLEIIDNYILTSSYDGLIRCHDINQNMASHSVYYGAGSATVMSMTAYKKWVFTGNRKGRIEGFKFDPSKQLACQYGRCRLKYGRECDVLHHVTIDHLPCVNMKTKRCPWVGCSHEFVPRTRIEEKQAHVKEHVICTY